MEEHAVLQLERLVSHLARLAREQYRHAVGLVDAADIDVAGVGLVAAGVDEQQL